MASHKRAEWFPAVVPSRAPGCLRFWNSRQNDGEKAEAQGRTAVLAGAKPPAGPIATNDMSIAGYVLKAARTAKDRLPGRVVGPGDIIVGDRLQAEGERVRVSPANQSR